MKKKIIFLDIDGVMNSEVDYLLATDKERGLEEAYEISNRCMGLLNNLIEETEAEVVISSVWRFGKTVEELQKLFDDHGFKGKIIGKTDDLRYNGAILRGNEILKWIQDNEEYLGKSYNDYDSYVIFDDDSDMLYWQRENFILIDGYTGLTHNKTYKAKLILNNR